MQSIRKEKRDEIMQQRDEIRKHNRFVKGKVSNRKALDQAAEDSLEQLLKNGKITL